MIKQSKDKNNPAQEIDLQAINYNLTLIPEKRLLQHQLSLDTVFELEKAHKELYAKLKSTP